MCVVHELWNGLWGGCVMVMGFEILQRTTGELGVYLHTPQPLGVDGH